MAKRKKIEAVSAEETLGDDSRKAFREAVLAELRAKRAALAPEYDCDLCNRPDCAKCPLLPVAGAEWLLTSAPRHRRAGPTRGLTLH